jgi:hypothetical protein
MKKIILVLLPLLMLAACNSNSSSDTSSEGGGSEQQEQVESEASSKELTTKVSISNEEFFQHFSYDISFNSTFKSDYAQNPTITYTTIVTMTVSQLRTGYVTYFGTGSFTVKLDWTYETTNGSGTKISAPKSDSFTVPYNTENYSTAFTFKKTYTTTHAGKDYSYQVESEIPYYTYIVNTGENHNPTATVSLSSLTMEATYYNNGVSGDSTLFVKSYEMNIANYLTYFEVSTTGINPKQSNELYDYRVIFTIDNQKYTLRRNGTYTFSPDLDVSFTVTNVEGFIDVYPGRVI